MFKEYFKDNDKNELPTNYNQEENPLIDKYVIIHPPYNDSPFQVGCHNLTSAVNVELNRWVSNGLNGKIAVYKLVDIIDA